MNKTLPTLRYLLKSFSVLIGIGFLVILSTVAITDWVYHATTRYNIPQRIDTLTVPFELSAGMFSLMIGLMYIRNFTVLLANGISRKTFLLASLPDAAIAAAAFSIFNLAVLKIHGIFWPIVSVSDVVYPSSGWVFDLILQFALYFLLIMASRFIILAFYRSNVPGRWALSLTPLALILILQQDAVNFEGRINRALGIFLRWSTVDSRVLATLFVSAAILFGLLYLLLRRAPLKD
jgi:hypothetical protein